jgi:hypothetical protein
MTRNLPAHSYDVFIKAFEQKVTAAQLAIERLRKVEAPYNILKEVMEAARLPNDQSIVMDPGYVSVHITATPDDSLEAFEALASCIGERLLKARLHGDGVPATSHGGSLCCLWFLWCCDAFDVRLLVHVPAKGMRDVEVAARDRHTVEREYVIARVERHVWRAPGWATVQRRGDDSEEVPF